MNHFVQAIVRNTILANLLLGTILVLGGMALLNLQREGMPSLDVNFVQIEVPYRGADPVEVEEGISRRIEAAIDGMEGIKSYHTTSSEGWGMATIEVLEGYEAEEVRNRIENAVASIDTFPDGVENPRYRVEAFDEEVINLALWGDVPERQLKALADTILDDIQRLPEVTLVEVSGGRPYEVNIEIKRDRLRQYGLSLDDVTRAINATSVNVSMGNIRAEGGEIRIRAIGRRYHGPEFGSIIVKTTPDGGLVTLDRIATISDSFKEDPSFTSFNGASCQLISVSKAPGEDSIAIADAVHAYAASKQQGLPPGVHVTTCFDDSTFIRGQIGMLTRNGVMGLFLVLTVLWVFLNTRLAFWIALGIPVSLSGALVLMWIQGISINEFSLITMIVVLGIIVDDAIVVGESIYAHRKHGKGPLQAATDGVMEVGAPVLAAVTTTIIAFLPLAYVPGMIGKVMALMPVIVISALLVSLVESLFMLPAHLNNLPDMRAQEDANAKRSRLQRWRQWPGRAVERFAERAYLPAVRFAVRHRYFTLCIAVSIIMITAGLIGGKFIRIIFWPPADGNHIRAQIEFPLGTPAEVTRDAVDHVRESFERVAVEQTTASGEPLVEAMFTSVYAATPHMGMVIVDLLDSGLRGIHSQDLAAAWEQDMGRIPGAISQTVREDAIGMRGPPIEIWLQAKDIEVAVAAAAELKDHLRTYDGVYQVEDDFRPGKTELQMRLKPEAHLFGLTLSDVARILRTGYYGAEPERLQRGRDDVRVRVRYPREERQTVADLEQVRIRTPSGEEVPLMSITDISLRQGYSSIHGVDGRRRIAVTAAVDIKRANPSEIVADLGRDYMDGLTARHANLAWSVEGVEASNRETVAGLQRGFIVAIFGIFVVLAGIFRSYAQPFLIVVIVPFGIIGAFLGHYALGIPVTLISLFGIVALTGVVVNDNIVLLECVNGLLARGTPFYEALCQGGVRRFRPIFLTTLSTVIGLLPIITETNLQAQMVIPMAVSIAAGVASATILTLLFMPALMAILNDGRRLAIYVITRRWLAPEDVEPATQRGKHLAGGFVDDDMDEAPLSGTT